MLFMAVSIHEVAILFCVSNFSNVTDETNYQRLRQWLFSFSAPNIIETCCRFWNLTIIFYQQKIIVQLTRLNNLVNQMYVSQLFMLFMLLSRYGWQWVESERKVSSLIHQVKMCLFRSSP